MASFFEKLKQDIGIEETEEETAVKKDKFLEEGKPQRKERKNEKPRGRAVKKELSPAKVSTDKPSFKQGPEAQLSLDVYETGEELVIQSTIAGVKAKDVDVSVENGVVTIRGNRQKPDKEEPPFRERKYFYQECYWGPFSRQVILPEEVEETKIEANIKDGILTLKMPKIRKKRERRIIIEEEE